MTQAVNFLGIPVEGTITRGESRVPQKPLEELSPLIQAVLDDPLFVAVCWRQYTPYFNDGDPCVFSTNAPWFVTTEDDEESVDYPNDDLGVDYGTHPTLGSREYTWGGQAGSRTRIPGVYTGSHESSYDRARDLSDAIASGAFDNVLIDAFGDHATVRVSRHRIDVEFYEHD